MNLDLNCIVCNINQVLKVTELSQMDRDNQVEMMKEVLGYLSNADYTKSNPEVFGGAWDIMLKYIENEDPYGDIKRYYNMEVLKMADAVDSLIKNSDDRFNTALKVAIAGNLIDFAAGHKFDFDMLKEKVMSIKEMNPVIDHSRILYERLKTAKSVMYLGDNCGEVSLDKLFIKHIKDEFPGVEVYFGVRGRAIINDVTFDDAHMVGMEEFAHIIENGDGSLGTVIDRVSDEFKEKFYNADVVIAKGQGNYEGLNGVDRNNVFYLFMAKCQAVSRALGVKAMSIICVENIPRQGICNISETA